jgi:DNA (cytosine-5)-methyltransferase 1
VRKTKEKVPSGHERVEKPFIRKFNSANRKAKPGRPSPTMISNAPDTAPLVREGPLKGDGAYASLLAAELPRAPPPGNGMTLASFFCCGGGIDLGFRSAGFRTTFANDIHQAAADTFEGNLGHRPLLRTIREVGPADYPASAPDVVTGGFPCVTFSMAGRRAGVTDDENGKLYLELCRVIRELNPRYFVAENVKGMLSANGGQAVKLVLAAFLRLGYRTSYELVNMAEHGVPQTRERVIFVGVRLDQWRGSFLFPRRTNRLRDDRRAKMWLPPARTLAQAVGDLGPPGERIKGMMHADAAAKVGKVGITNGFQNSKPRSPADPSHSQTSSGANVLDDQDVGDRNHARNDEPVSATYAMSKRVAKRGAPSPTLVSEAANVQPFMMPNHEENNAKAHAFQQTRVVASRGRRSPTATTPVQNQPFIRDGREVVERSGGMRRMTARECARVQSFPDWYEFAGSQADQYRIIGNAVPPLYAKALALALAEYDGREKA